MHNFFPSLNILHGIGNPLMTKFVSLLDDNAYL